MEKKSSFAKHNGRKKALLVRVMHMVLCSVVLFCFFVIGIAVGMQGSAFWQGNGFGKTVRMGRYFERDLRGGAWNMMGAGYGRGMMGNVWYGEDGANGAATSMFGVITKIEANKITVSDNAAKSQVVLSQSDTVIQSGAGEVALGTLKVGQTVLSVGALDKDGQLLAKFMRVMAAAPAAVAP